MAVSPHQTIGLRVPGHPVILDVLRMSAGPLCLSSANRKGMPEAVSAQEIVDTFGDALAMVIDDGPCRFGQPSSVVRINGGQCEILRVGVVPERTLRRLSSVLVLFVCTGNTCRSPMAELLCRDLVAKRLHCGIDELEDHGVMVMSAGLAAMLGGRASIEAVQVLTEMGLDLNNHETQPLTEPLVRHADVIYTMTRSHREAIVSQWPSAAERTHLLAADGSDICDPIGSSAERYRCCANQIRSALNVRLEQLQLS
jgi:protein-tyrosine-phosphatase